MEFFITWILLASVVLVAIMSPGPAFIVTTRTALLHGRKAGFILSLGLAAGITMHVAFVLVGLSFIISESVFLLNVIKYVGAAYLLYIGIKAIRCKDLSPREETEEERLKSRAEIKTYKGPFKLFTVGFLAELLNPKTVLFFTAVYTQFVTPDMPVSWMIAFALTTITIEICWFSLVSFVLSSPHVKERFMGFMGWINKVCGGLMIALGVKLALSKL